MLFGASYGYGQEQAKVKKLKVVTSVDQQALTISENSGQRIVGKVHLNELNACGIWIEVEKNEKVIRLIPDNLEESFKVDGVIIQFEYKLSENRSSNVCVGTSSVHLNNVSLKSSR